MYTFCMGIPYFSVRKISNPKIHCRRIFSMIIKTEDFELEISVGRDVYFGSRTSGQIFKNWDDLKDDEKIELKKILQKVQHLILESEGLLLETQIPYTEDPEVSQPMSTVSYLAG